MRGLRLIARAMEQNRLSHAYLVTGPPGSGKRQLIRQCALFLLCNSPIVESSTPGACMACNGCIKFERGVHPDFMELEAQGRFIRIDQVRVMQKMIAFAPLESKRRVVAIASADRLNVSASNALLKTLEEPPENTHLFLAAPSSSRLLPTIVSRCQILPLDLQAGDSVFDDNLAVDSGESARTFMEYVSGSSPRLREQMVEEGILDARETIFDFLLSGQKKEGLFHASKKIGQSRESLGLALKVLQTVTRDLLLLSSSGSMATRYLINQDKAAELTELAQGLNYDSLLEYHELIDKAERYLERNVNPEMISDALLIFWIKSELQNPTL